MAGETEGFCARVKELNSLEKSSYCILHMAKHASRELLVLVNVRILSKMTAARLAQILALIICIYFSIPMGFHSIIFLTVLVFSVLLRCFGSYVFNYGFLLSPTKLRTHLLYWINSRSQRKLKYINRCVYAYVLDSRILGTGHEFCQL